MATESGDATALDVIESLGQLAQVAEEAKGGLNPDVVKAFQTIHDFIQEGQDEENVVAHVRAAVGKDGEELLTTLAKELAILSGLDIKEGKKSLKKVWDKTLGLFWKELKKNMISKDGFQILGATLSAPGKVMSGLSEFWDEAQKEHPLLKYADKPVKAFAIALYVEGAPVVGAIKAAELVGRTAEEYGKTRKFWPSLKKASRDWADSLYHHFLRLTIGNDIKPAMEQFYKTLGMREKDAQNFVKVVQAYDQLGRLDQMSKKAAGIAANQVSNLASDLMQNHPVLSNLKYTAVDLGLIASIILPASDKNISYSQIKEIASAVLDPDLSDQLSKLSPRIKSFAMERIVQAVIHDPSHNIQEIVTKSMNDLADAKDIKVNVDGVGAHIKKHNPVLHKKLKVFLDVGKGQEVSFEQVESLMKSSKQLKKMKKADRKELMKYVTEYAVENVLSEHLGASAAREVQEPKQEPQKKKKFADRFRKGRNTKKKFASKIKPKKKTNFVEMIKGSMGKKTEGKKI